MCVREGEQRGECGPAEEAREARGGQFGHAAAAVAALVDAAIAAVVGRFPDERQAVGHEGTPNDAAGSAAFAGRAEAGEPTPAEAAARRWSSERRATDVMEPRLGAHTPHAYRVVSCAHV